MAAIDSSLVSLFGSDTSSSSILGTLYGNSAAVSSGALNALSALRLAENNQTKSIATTAKQSDVARDVAAFRKGIASAKDAASALKNPSVLKVLLTANGLSDQLGYTALATRTLLSNINDKKSLANTLTDTRWKAVVKSYDFANKGLTNLKSASVQNTIANGYAEIAWRKSLDATTPGLSNALSFRSHAAGITSVDQILGDRTLRTVVTTALGIPQQIAFQGLLAQEKAISSRVDITKFKDPKFVETFTQRYLIAAGNAATSTTGSDLSSLAVSATSLMV
jgi:hypothetical protein